MDEPVKSMIHYDCLQIEIRYEASQGRYFDN